MTMVYLPDIGFRAAGVRLVAPVRAARQGRTLTLRELVATPEGTELSYLLTGLTGDEGYTPRQDLVAIRSGGVEQVLERGAFTFGSDPPGLRRQIRSQSAIPRRAGPVEVTIAIERVGEFQLAADMRPFGPETDVPRHDVNKSVTHDGITVVVRGVGAAREETAVEIEVAVGERECLAGIGGYASHRMGPTALSISDEHGRVYAERWREARTVDHATVALFEPLDPQARELELVVPYVIVEEPVRMEAVPLPVTSPVEARLGTYGIRVLATAPMTAHYRPLHGRQRKPALGVDLDLGGWNGDRRVFLPGSVLLDGNPCEVSQSYGGPLGLMLAQAEPVSRLEIRGDRWPTAKTLGFERPCIQVRGWRIPFRLA